MLDKPAQEWNADWCRWVGVEKGNEIIMTGDSLSIGSVPRGMDTAESGMGIQTKMNISKLLGLELNSVKRFLEKLMMTLERAA